MLLPTISGFLFFGGGFTQRPSAASICDYYAIHRYGANSTDTQSQLMQSILALAFAGATSTMYNISSEVTGIFNPGVFQNTPVDLQAYFNGSIDSTNLNNQPVGINWLDAGGKTPLLAYLSGQSSSLFTTNTTNEYRLFSHWQAAFSRIFGCTLPKPVAPQVGGYLNLAYVHKFMDLNYTDVGHFINQLTKSSVYFGFGEQDAATLSTKMNAQYNVRCAPAVPNPVLGPQLYSLCQDETCPLAAPNADCAAYVDLGPSGANTAPASTATSAFSPSSVKPTTLPTTTSTTSSATSSATTSAAAAAATLSPGAIAGTSIGGAAVLFLFIAGLVFLFRKKKPLNDPYIPNIPSQHNPSYVAPSYTDPHMSYMSGSTQQGYGGQWVGPTIAEMESPKHGASPEMGGYVHPVPSPVYPAPERHQMAA